MAYDNVEYYLITDPAFEAFHRNLRESGYSISFLARDSFEETVKVRTRLKVFRKIMTVVGSGFDVAVDKKHHYILVTTDVPAISLRPPVSTEKGQQLNLIAMKQYGHGS